MRLVIIIAFLGLLSCDQKSAGNEHASNSEPPVPGSPKDAAEEIPDAIMALVDRIIEAMPEETKAEIRKVPRAELMVDHMGMGMALRNGELNQRDSEVVNYLKRKGIYHRDDFSTIVLLSVNRKLRGDTIDLKRQIQDYREYWAKLDIVAPLDLACPSCGKEMEVSYLGNGVSANFPHREYFQGRCPLHGSFIYYYGDGWKACAALPYKDNLAAPSNSEKVTEDRYLAVLYFRIDDDEKKKNIMTTRLSWHPDDGMIYLIHCGGVPRIASDKEIADLRADKTHWLFSDTEERILEELRKLSKTDRLQRIKGMDEVTRRKVDIFPRDKDPTGIDKIIDPFAK